LDFLLLRSFFTCLFVWRAYLLRFTLYSAFAFCFFLFYDVKFKRNDEWGREKIKGCTVVMSLVG